MAIPNIGLLLTSTKQIGGNAAETAVAKAFLAAHVNDYDRVDIELKLGPGMTIGMEYPPYMQKYAAENFKLRADMVCWNGNVPTIVECKDRLDGRAVGQLLTYATLIREDNPTILQVYKVAAGQSVLIGVEKVFEANGISIELYPTAEATWNA